MAKDFAFQFCPGDYLRDTQCLSEKAQVAYDRIMCEHIRSVSNDMQSICIPHDKVSFFAKRLNEDEKAELYHVLSPVGGKNGGFQIEWVAEKVAERQRYIESRVGNGSQKKTKAHDKHEKAYAELPDSDSDNIDLVSNKKNNTTLKKRTTKVRGIPFRLLDLIPAEWPQDDFSIIWAEFVEMRKAKNKPLTENAVKRRVAQLISVSDGSYQKAAEIVLRSTDNQWDEFYRPRPERFDQNGLYSPKTLIRDKA